MRRLGERRCVAETRFRDLDGHLRKVTATAGSASAARALLKERLVRRSGYGSGGVLGLSSPFGDLVALWLADLELRDLAAGTKENYRDQIRLHVLPAFEHFTLGEITTGRVEWFLRSEVSASPSRATKSRTMLNLLFGFALRQDAIPRNPVEGASSLRAARQQPKALTPEQISSIRAADARWRTEPGRPGPKPDGQVRDILEVLLGTAMRPGEVMALRPCDIEQTADGTIASVTGTVVQRRGLGTVRQARPKSDASIRRIAVPEFAAAVLRRRMAGVDPQRTIFANRGGGPLSPYNLRRTFREFLHDADLAESGIAVQAIIDVVEELINAHITLEDEYGTRTLLPRDIAVGVTHRDQRDHVRTALQAARARTGLPVDEVVVDTANVLQGREFQVVVVWHPLSGRRDASQFHLDAGRLCVLLSRHRRACIAVSRGGIRDQLAGHAPTEPVWLGESAPVLDGWHAHLAVLDHLAQYTV